MYCTILFIYYIYFIFTKWQLIVLSCIFIVDLNLYLYFINFIISKIDLLEKNFVLV